MKKWHIQGFFGWSFKCVGGGGRKAICDSRFGWRRLGLTDLFWPPGLCFSKLELKENSWQHLRRKIKCSVQKKNPKSHRMEVYRGIHCKHVHPAIGRRASFHCEFKTILEFRVNFLGPLTLPPHRAGRPSRTVGGHGRPSCAAPRRRRSGRGRGRVYRVWGCARRRGGASGLGRQTHPSHPQDTRVGSTKNKLIFLNLRFRGSRGPSSRPRSLSGVSLQRPLSE